MEQSLNWLTNGLSIFGGAGMVWAGGALCGTGLGCIIGAPLIAHGANGIYEGIEGLVEGRDDIDGRLRDTLFNWSILVSAVIILLFYLKMIWALESLGRR
ncbi:MULTISPECIES: DUF4225 domain-containing protein [Morganellaceae]|uniref:DUF4225 domain-containing protein n=1 Tax=Morganellaceae TaxID=1903414 RepID=UPI0021CB2B4C|nr:MULTISPECIES: DUF4225 domain-containing protein [Morganellaceae]MCU9581926.1 DUF4225 domain-containing protein [Proteus mirabilis]